MLTHTVDHVDCPACEELARRIVHPQKPKPDLDGAINEDRAAHPVIIETDAGTLLAVHAFLTLALRHQKAGRMPSSNLVAKFARSIMQACVVSGLFTERGMQLIAFDENSEDRALPESILKMREKGGHA